MNLYPFGCTDGVPHIHAWAIEKQESYPAAIPEISGSLQLPFSMKNFELKAQPYPKVVRIGLTMVELRQTKSNPISAKEK